MLDILAKRLVNTSVAKVTGKITLNGEECTQRMFRQVSGYVKQEV